MPKWELRKAALYFCFVKIQQIFVMIITIENNRVADLKNHDTLIRPLHRYGSQTISLSAPWS